MSLRDALVGALHDMTRLRVPHAIIGGLAVSARTEPRLTRDVDLAIAVVNDEAAERVIYELREQGYGVSGVLEQSAVGRLATTRLVPPGLKGSGVVVDLLFASSGIEPEVVEAAEHILILKDVSAPVATIGHLIALKLLSEGKRRPHDAADLVALSKAASPFDFAQARSAVRLIAERGYNRGRDLETALSALIGSVDSTF